MLRSRSLYMPSSPAKGFSLIEMMISITIGMIVAAGAVLLIVAIDRSNSESIQSARINLEMRALSSVIADEIKRARRLHDPVAAVGQGAASNGTVDFVDTSTAGCIRYAYQDTPLNDGVTNEERTNKYAMIYRTTTNGVGSVVFAVDSSDTDFAATSASPSPLTCGDATNVTTSATLTSSQMDITSLTFSCVTLVGTTVTSSAAVSASCNQIDMTVTAKLLSGDTTTKKIAHTYVQQVFIRSGAVKTT